MIYIFHCHNIYHSDIKPANIVIALDIEGDVILKLIDFGIITNDFKQCLGITLNYVPEFIRQRYHQGDI